MEQGIDKFVNVDLPVSYAEIDYVLLTHAHIDHAGMLPFIYARGFRGQVISTVATADLCGIMLKDSAIFRSPKQNGRTERPGGQGFRKKNPCTESMMPWALWSCFIPTITMKRWNWRMALQYAL